MSLSSEVFMKIFSELLKPEELIFSEFKTPSTSSIFFASLPSPFTKLTTSPKSFPVFLRDLILKKFVGVVEISSLAKVSL